MVLKDTQPGAQKPNSANAATTVMCSPVRSPANQKMKAAMKTALTPFSAVLMGGMDSILTEAGSSFSFGRNTRKQTSQVVTAVKKDMGNSIIM